MKYIRFYQETPNKGNVIALFLPVEEHRSPDGSIECLASLFNVPDSQVASTSVSPEYLKTCQRISEEVARSIHPNLFKRLDKD